MKSAANSSSQASFRASKSVFAASWKHALAQIQGTTNTLMVYCNSTSPEILAVVDQRSADCTGHAAFLRLLDVLRPALVATVESFYNDQIATMLNTGYSCKKRVGIFSTVATLPSFVQHYEQVAKLAAGDSATRQLVSLVEEKLAAALFRNLVNLAAEGDAVGAGIGDDEDKGRLNAAVMIIGMLVCFFANFIQKICTT